MDMHISNISQDIFSDFVHNELGSNIEISRSVSSIRMKLPTEGSFIEHRIYHRLGKPDIAEINIIIRNSSFPIDSLSELKDIFDISNKSNASTKLMDYIHNKERKYHD